MKIIIVDDEINICILIQQLIEWDKLGLTFAGRASNGKEAIEMIGEILPDIVITDIRMPGMGGLELVKESNRLYGDKVNFVIVSGHKQFDYAYEAIKYGVVDFLLKPVNKDELNQVLVRFVESQRKDRQHHTRTAEDRNHIVRKQFLINLLHNPDEVSRLKVEEINAEYSYQFSDGVFLPTIIKLDNYEVLSSLQGEFRSKIESQFYKRFTPLCDDLVSYQKQNEFFFILNFHQQEQPTIYLNLETFLGEILGVTRPFHFVKATIGLGLPESHLELIANFRRGEKAVLSRSMVGVNRIIDFRSYEDTEEFPPVYMDKEASEKSQELLDKKMVRNLCTSFFEKVKAATKKTPYQAVPLILREVQIMVMGAVKYHIPEQSADYTQIIAQYSFDQCMSPEDVLSRMEHLIISAYDKIIESRETEDNKIIKTVKDYINENIDRQVSLEEVSKLVYLSPAYLGILFKKETGKLFSQYTTDVKMSKAKEYLRNMDSSIKEIASMLGYKDIRNFSKLFRNTIGVKPTEYRKLYHLD